VETIQQKTGSFLILENGGIEKKMRKALIAGCALILLPLISAVYAHHIPPAIPAPDFTVTDIDGNPFTLSAQTGKVVLINFFFIG
jgi:cytochrome oxidase Cu insertion factor (SCO1/SenC/PrrC family)